MSVDAGNQSNVTFIDNRKSAKDKVQSWFKHKRKSVIRDLDTEEMGHVYGAGGSSSGGKGNSSPGNSSGKGNNKGNNGNHYGQNKNKNSSKSNSSNCGCG